MAQYISQGSHRAQRPTINVRGQQQRIQRPSNLYVTMAGMWSVLNLHGYFCRIRQTQEKSLITLFCGTQCFISCDVSHTSASCVFIIIHTSMLSCKQPESTNSHETEGGETQGQRDRPPINPCNEIGQYSGASARPSLIGRPLILISP